MRYRCKSVKHVLRNSTGFFFILSLPSRSDRSVPTHRPVTFPFEKRGLVRTNHDIRPLTQFFLTLVGENQVIWLQREWENAGIRSLITFPSILLSFCSRLKDTEVRFSTCTRTTCHCFCATRSTNSFSHAWSRKKYPLTSSEIAFALVEVAISVAILRTGLAGSARISLTFSKQCMRRHSEIRFITLVTYATSGPQRTRTGLEFVCSLDLVPLDGQHLDGFKLHPT